MRDRMKISTIFWSMVVVLLLASSPALASGQQATSPPADDGVGTAATTSGNDEETAPAAPAGTALPMQLQPMEGPGMVWGSIRSEGQIAIGVRGVSQNGSEGRYAKDVDLDSGIRILETHWVLSPENRGAGQWFDRAVIDINGAGGDPYENYGVSLSKIGKYRFDARTRKVDYKYTSTGDHKVWDVTRWFTDIKLSVRPVNNLDLYADYGRFTQNGDMNTTFDFSRNEFVMDAPIDTEGQSWAVGARYNRSGTSAFIEQEFYSFKDNVGRMTFNNTGLSPDESEIDMLQDSELRSINAPITKGGINALLLDNRVQLNADLLYSEQDMAYAYDLYWTGLDFSRRPTDGTEGSLGEATRKVLHGNFFAGFQVIPRASVTARYRYRSWDQSGSNRYDTASLFTETGAASVDIETNDSVYKITDNQFLVGGKGSFDQGSVYAEVGVSNRDQSFLGGLIDDAEETKTVALRVGGTYRPSRMLDLKLGYDLGDVDDPFTRISPTRVNKFRVRLNARPVMGVLVGGHFVYRNVENTMSDLDLTQKGVGFHATYDWNAGNFVTVAYSRNDIDRAITMSFWFPRNNLVTDTIVQDLADNVFTVATDVTVSPDLPLTVYGSVNIAKSDSDEPELPDLGPLAVVRLNFYDLIGGARYVFPNGLFFDAQGRYINYEDTGDLVSAGVDDYDAAIFTLLLGFRFD